MGNHNPREGIVCGSINWKQGDIQFAAIHSNLLKKELREPMRSTHKLCIAFTLRVSHLRLLLVLFLFAPLFAGADVTPPPSQPTYDYDNTLPVYRYPSLIASCQALLETPMWGNVKSSGAHAVVEVGNCYFEDAGGRVGGLPLYGRGTPPPPPPPPPPPELLLNINATMPSIPSFSGVVQGKVLTKSKLSLTLTQNQTAVVGKQVPLASNRGSQVDLIEPNVVLTDANGQASTWISTRVQPGSSTVSASDATIKTTSPGVVTWLPAKYVSEFLVTCYNIASEAEAPKTPVSQKVCGLPQDKAYRTAFLDQTQMQGSGQALDGTFVHYKGNGCYNPDTCARTASGACAVAGTTIAVDPRIIPMKSTVNVGAGIGQRIAQDKGKRIIAYHIDEYLGAVPKSTCDKLGLRYTSVTLMNY